MADTTFLNEDHDATCFVASIEIRLPSESDRLSRIMPDHPRSTLVVVCRGPSLFSTLDPPLRDGSNTDGEDAVCECHEVEPEALACVHRAHVAVAFARLSAGVGFAL